MTDLNCKDILPMIRGDFGSLWHCRELGKGKTLEIVTPHLYPDSTFVSVFITKRSGKFIVADGGYLSEFIEAATDDVAFLTAVFTKFRGLHAIQECELNKKTFYYKETKDIKLISSLVFDLCNFIGSTANAAAMAVTEEEDTDKKSFRAMADRFIRSNIPRAKKRKLYLNYSLPNIKEATFSAAVMESTRLWLVIYLTGSNFKYFQLSVANAIVNAQLVKNSNLSGRVAATIPLINNSATGYVPRKLEHRLEMLEGLTHTKPVLWSDKERLTSLLNAA